MSQLTIQTSGGITPGGGRNGRRRPMRSERMVSLRSTMPIGLVTLRHDVPEYIKEATPKVDNAERAERAGVDTPVRKGGEAQW
jgi:hypothetical protein